VDIALIAVVKHSPQYRAIRAQVADPCPVDSWYEDGLAFIVFALHPPESSSTETNIAVYQAGFVLLHETGTLLDAHVVALQDDGTVNEHKMIITPPG
jgi:hypothetical protein